jgi:dTDP-glucose 4,6-dehydratase
LESFAWANDKLGLGASALVLTRNPDIFRAKAPHLAGHPAIQLHAGDIRSFEFPDGVFSHVIHAATEASAKLNEENPLLMFDTIVEGTRRALEFARHSGVKSFLLTSSGAVYGRQPPDLTHIPEDYSGGPEVTAPHWAYGEGKRAAEMLCALYAKQYGLRPTIARCFAFVGPYLPLDIHYAIGNFLRDGRRGGPITVNGDGTPSRSYLYAADLAIWLWTILARGQPVRPYNVGSEMDLSIRETAQAVAGAFQPPVNVTIKRAPEAGRPAERYVPATRRAQAELGLQQRVPLPDALRRTLEWCGTSSA